MNTPGELKEGIDQINKFCDEIGRNRSGLDFSVFGLGDQWKSKAEHEQLAAAGANRTILSLTSTKTDSMKAELDELAKSLI